MNITRTSFQVANTEQLKTGEVLDELTVTHTDYNTNEVNYENTLIMLDKEHALALTDNIFAGQALFNLIKDASPSTLEMVKELFNKGMQLTVKGETQTN